MSLQTDQANFYANGAVSLTEAFTGFNELTVSEGYPIIDLKSVYGVSNLRDRVDVAGTGSVTTERGLYKLSTGATAGSTASLTSVEYGRYVAGFEATPGIGVMLSRLPTGNEVARWGYYTADNGFGYGADVNGFFTFIRSGGVERVTRQEDWYRGNFQFDWGSIVIYRMPFRWYGSGPVNYEIAYTDKTGVAKLKKVHYEESEVGEPITENPNLPIRAEVTNGGDATDFELYVGGRQFFIQGRYNPNRRVTADHRFTASVGTTFVPLVSWRQKADFESVSVKLQGATVLATGANMLYEVRVGSDLTGATFDAPSNTPAAETALEFDKVATAVAGGHKLYAEMAVAGQGNSAGATRVEFPNIDIAKDEVLTLCARTVSGTGTATAILKAREEW